MKTLSTIAIAALFISGWNWREPIRIAENKFSENTFIFTGINEVPVRLYNNTFIGDAGRSETGLTECWDTLPDGRTLITRSVPDPKNPGRRMCDPTRLRMARDIAQ